MAVKTVSTARAAASRPSPDCPNTETILAAFFAEIFYLDHLRRQREADAQRVAVTIAASPTKEATQ